LYRECRLGDENLGHIPVHFKKNHTDVLIIGGGIVGVGLLRDLALHGIDCLLVNKGDFSSQTSQASSKMLHGGIRYLEKLDFGLVREALEEKNLWLKLTPHLCFERPFHLPNFKESKFPLPFVKIGLIFYDFLSHFQNTPYQILNKSQTLNSLPGLKSDGLKGCGVYYDAIMDDLKLTLECLYDALIEENAEAKSYLEVVGIEKKDNKYFVQMLDQLSGKDYCITTNEIVFATGPFTDQLMKKLKIKNWNPVLILSKGTHLWLKKEIIPITVPMVLQTGDNRIIFVIPQKGAILVGTTESIVDSEEIFNIKANENEIQYLIETLQHYFPGSKIEPHHIIKSFAGVRPLVKEEGVKNLGKVSRHHKVYQIASDMHVIIGGKYTTFRRMVQNLAQQIINKRGGRYNENKCLSSLRQKSIVLPFIDQTITSKNIHNIIAREYIRTSDDIIYRRIGELNQSNIPERPSIEKEIEKFL